MASTRGWSLEEILEDGPNFHRVERVNANSAHLLQTIKKFEEKGIPLVIEGFHKHRKWPQHIFTLDHFSKHCGSSDINVRNVHNWKDSTISLTEFISKCRLAGPHRTEAEKERFYGKDSECPQTWDKWLQSGGVIPQELISKGPNDMFQYRPSNPQAVIETLMCYLGIGDTFTPCHKDVCASSGQNLMCYTESNGSSFWFMTASSSASLAAEYLQSLEQELDHENYIITLDELKKAPFKIFVLEQKLGDMVLVPPRSCHQVINSGGITVKTSWSRMTLKGLATAYHHELPIYRRVCRPETYRIKSTICHALIAHTAQLVDSSNVEDRPLFQDLKALVLLYEAILTEEGQAENLGITVKLASKSTIFYDDNRIVCDFCSGDIFQSFFECRLCCESTDEPCHLCPGCYAEGRTCKCSTPEMIPMQSQNFGILLDIRSKSLKAIHNYESRNGISSNFKNELASVRTSTAAVFQGGCRLYKIRMDSEKKPPKVCTLSSTKDENHSVRFSWALTCKKCHYSRCFPHILTAYRMHSVEALLIHASDETSSLYHDRHMGARTKFENSIECLDKTKKQGVSLYDMQSYHILVDSATRFTHCKPANPKFMQLGWYDKPLADTSAAQHVPTISARREMLKEKAAVMSTVSGEISAPITSKSSNLKKRKLIPFVDVPKAPYNISRVKSTLNVHFSQQNQIRSLTSSDSLGEQIRDSQLSSAIKLTTKESIIQTRVDPLISIFTNETPQGVQGSDDHTTKTVRLRKLKIKKVPISMSPVSTSASDSTDAMTLVDDVAQPQHSKPWSPQDSDTLPSSPTAPVNSPFLSNEEARSREETSATSERDNDCYFRAVNDMSMLMSSVGTFALSRSFNTMNQQSGSYPEQSYFSIHQDDYEPSSGIQNQQYIPQHGGSEVPVHYVRHSVDHRFFAEDHEAYHHPSNSQRYHYRRADIPRPFESQQQPLDPEIHHRYRESHGSRNSHHNISYEEIYAVSCAKRHRTMYPQRRGSYRPYNSKSYESRSYHPYTNSIHTRSRKQESGRNLERRSWTREGCYRSNPLPHRNAVIPTSGLSTATSASHSVSQDEHHLPTGASTNTLQERTDDSERDRTPTDNLPIINDDDDQQIWEDGYEQTEESAPSLVTFRTDGLSRTRNAIKGDKIGDELAHNPWF